MADPLGSNFIEGVLGVVQMYFDGIDLGKTLDEATLEFIEDIKDIMFAQNGTQPADKIPTGQAYQITANFAQRTWARLEKLLRGVTVVGNSAKLGVDLYRSGYDNFAKQLILYRVDSDGVVSTSPIYRLVMYKAMPTVSGPIATFGPDTQQQVTVTFYCFKDTTKNAFGYSGYASSLGL